MIGVVEQYTQSEVVGWLETEQPRKVDLKVNRHTVASSWAANPTPFSPDFQSFRFALKDIWLYLSPVDTLTVEVDGRALPIVGNGTRIRPSGKGKYTSSELIDRVENRHFVFNQFGRMQLSVRHNQSWKNQVFALYDMVAAFFEKENVPFFVFYGTMLGALREADFIGHDHDFDAAYLVAESDPERVIEKSTELALKLIGAGFTVNPKQTTMYVSHPRFHSNVSIDLFHIYFDHEGDLMCPFGSAGEVLVKKGQFRGVSQIEMAGHKVSVPAPGEAFCATVYGSSWRTPNPGFAWKKDRRRSSSQARFGEARQSLIYWNGFYARERNPPPSAFQSFIAGSRFAHKHVLEFGAGDGRDTIGFAAGGCSAVGFDQSLNGVLNGRRRAGDLGLDAEFGVLDVSDVVQLCAAIARHRPAASAGTLLYSRFFVHSLPDEVRKSFFAGCAGAMQPGDFFALEFRTDGDKDAPKVHGGHYRNFISSEQAIKELTGLDLTLLLRQEGTGFAVYETEDPTVCRLVLGKG